MHCYASATRWCQRTLVCLCSLSGMCVCVHICWCSQGFPDIRPCGRRREREREGGRVLGVVVHLGWSASHCGKTQYLHFVIRTAFTLSFSTTRIYAHLHGEGGSVGHNVLHLFITARRSGQRCECVQMMLLVSFMKVVLLFESCAPDVMAELLSFWECTETT